jgi:hypothetical protein
MMRHPSRFCNGIQPATNNFQTEAFYDFSLGRDKDFLQKRETISGSGRQMPKTETLTLEKPRVGQRQSRRRGL